MHCLTDIKESIDGRKVMYAIYVDQELVGYLNAQRVLDMGLVVNQVLPEEAYTKLIQTINFTKYYLSGLHYADRRLRSKAEVSRYLLSIGCMLSDAELIVSKLSDLGIVDDLKLAKAYVHDLLISKPQSKKMLAVKLSKKLIDKDIISQVIDEQVIEEADSLQAVVGRKSKLSAYRNNQPRLFRYLLSQGYSFDEVSAVIGLPERKN